MRKLFQKAAFFDRDGTINVDIEYLHKPEDLEFVSGVPELIKMYNDMGHKVIMITNQSEITHVITGESDYE
jgi:D-glycero-D-manno-heptose 1,7-bisphosphate phosphatase